MTDRSAADDADRVLTDCLEDFGRRRALEACDGVGTLPQSSSASAL